MRELSDSVSHLKGCGKKTLEKFHSIGIHTYGDLISYSGLVLGCDIIKFKEMAKKELSQKKHITSHSWHNRICHITRKNGGATRVRIKDLVIFPHRILMNVIWIEKKQTKRKSVSPLMLIATQVLWIDENIVSDDSDSDSCEKLERVLPKLSIDPLGFDIKNLKPSEGQALLSLIKETNHFRNCFLRPEYFEDGDQKA